MIISIISWLRLEPRRITIPINHFHPFHASCSCPIGDPKQGGVVNGDFEVHGTKGLRIVDASVFPRFPGFFIVTSIYMIGEKAADVISKAATN